MPKGLISRVLPQSFVDGPGNRAVVFLQGCNLRCLYCHNLSTLALCRACGQCVSVCPAGALRSEGGRILRDPRRCRDCEACLEACPHFSSPRVREMTERELWEEIRPSADYLTGVTATGGEATLQLDFLEAFFTLVQSASRLSTLVETNGSVGPRAFARLLPVLDTAIVDLKAFDAELHRRLTGQENGPVKETIAFLAREKRLDSVRLTVVPGLTDGAGNARETGRFLRSLDPQIPLRFQRFRPHGTRGAASQWAPATSEVLDLLCAVAREEGLENVSRSL